MLKSHVFLESKNHRVRCAPPVRHCPAGPPARKRTRGGTSGSNRGPASRTTGRRTRGGTGGSNRGPASRTTAPLAKEICNLKFQIYFFKNIFVRVSELLTSLLFRGGTGGELAEFFLRTQNQCVRTRSQHHTLVYLCESSQEKHQKCVENRQFYSPNSETLWVLFKKCTLARRSFQHCEMDAPCVSALWNRVMTAFFDHVRKRSISKSANSVNKLPFLIKNDTQKLSLEWVRPVSVARLGVFPVTLWRDATRAVFERVRGSSIGHRRLGERVSAEHTRYRVQQKETLKKHFPKKTIYFVTVQLWWK